MKRLVVAIALATSPCAALAADTQIGSWEMSYEKSAFKEGTSTVVAIATNGSGYAIGLRCLQGDLSIALVELSGVARAGRFAVGDNVQVRFRAGVGNIVERTATATTDTMIAVDDVDDMIRQLGLASKFAFQIRYRGVTSEISFSTKGNPKATDYVLKGCAGGPPA